MQKVKTKRYKPPAGFCDTHSHRDGRSVDGICRQCRKKYRTKKGGRMNPKNQFDGSNYLARTTSPHREKSE